MHGFGGIFDGIDRQSRDRRQTGFRQRTGDAIQQAERQQVRHGESGDRHVAGESDRRSHGGGGRVEGPRGADDADFTRLGAGGERLRRRVHVDLEDPDERRPHAKHPPADVVASDADGDQVGRIQDLLRCHDFHPWLSLCHISSALAAAAGVVAIFFGHGRVKPSEGHLRVASIPILLP